jgi:flotillin
MMLQVLPKVAAEVSAPIAQCNKITMVSDGTGSIGAANVTKEILTIMESLPETVKKMTGVDISNKVSIRG